MLNHRSNTVVANGANGTPIWGAGYFIYVGPVGAVVTSTSTSTTVNVRTPHSLRASDKFLMNPGANEIFSEAISSVDVSAGTITMPNALSVTKGDLLFNLGPDGGTTSPDYDAIPGAVYSDPDGTTAITSNKVTADSTLGTYDYWHYRDGTSWELIQDTSAVNQRVVKGWGGQGRYNVQDFGAIGDGSTTDTTRVQSALDCANNTTDETGGTVVVPGTGSSYLCNVTIYRDTTLRGQWSVLDSARASQLEPAVDGNTLTFDTAGKPQRITVRDLVFANSNKATFTTNDHINIVPGDNCAHVILENLQLWDAGRRGIFMDGGTGNGINHPRLSHVLINRSAKEDLLITNKVLEGNYDHVVTQGSGYSDDLTAAPIVLSSDDTNGVPHRGNWVNCAFKNDDHTSGPMVHIAGAREQRFESCHFENSVGYFKLDNPRNRNITVVDSRFGNSSSPGTPEAIFDLSNCEGLYVDRNYVLGTNIATNLVDATGAASAAVISRLYVGPNNDIRSGTLTVDPVALLPRVDAVSNDISIPWYHGVVRLKAGDDIYNIYDEDGGTGRLFEGLTVTFAPYTDAGQVVLRHDQASTGNIRLKGNQNITLHSSSDTVTLAYNDSSDGNRVWMEVGRSDSAESGIELFDVDDATPSVASGQRLFRTNNTSITITDFDDGAAGQEIWVRLDANTIIDFTGSSLKGNNGANYTAGGTADVLHCVYYGANWHCVVIDGTA